MNEYSKRSETTDFSQKVKTSKTLLKGQIELI